MHASSICLIFFRLSIIFSVFALSSLESFAQEGKVNAVYINSKGHTVLPVMTVTAKSLNLPNAEIHTNNSLTLNEQSFRSIHQALGAREGIAVNFHIPFSENSTVPTAEGRATIEEISRAMKFLNPNLTYEIQCHSATLSQEKNNEALALSRAKKVVNYLQVNEGVKNLLTVNSYGSKIPITTNETDVGKQMNSRITIVNKGIINN